MDKLKVQLICYYTIDLFNVVIVVIIVVGRHKDDHLHGYFVLNFFNIIFNFL